MADTVFACASLLAIIAWLSLALGLIVQPGTQRQRLLRFAGRHVPVILCALYAGVLWTYWGKVPNGGFASLTSVVALFSLPGKMLGGWIHFLAVDLLVGRGVIDHGLAQGYPRAALIGVAVRPKSMTYFVRRLTIALAIISMVAGVFLFKLLASFEVSVTDLKQIRWVLILGMPILLILSYLRLRPNSNSGKFSIFLHSVAQLAIFFAPFGWLAQRAK